MFHDGALNSNHAFFCWKTVQALQVWLRTVQLTQSSTAVRCAGRGCNSNLSTWSGQCNFTRAEGRDYWPECRCSQPLRFMVVVSSGGCNCNNSSLSPYWLQTSGQHAVVDGRLYWNLGMPSTLILMRPLASQGPKDYGRVHDSCCKAAWIWCIDQENFFVFLHVLKHKKYLKNLKLTESANQPPLFLASSPLRCQGRVHVFTCIHARAPLQWNCWFPRWTLEN